MGVGHTTGTRKDELVELSSKDDEAAAVSPRRPFAVQTSCAGNIICFLAVPGSLCRHRKFNRARALFSPDASVNPVFDYIPPLRGGSTIRPTITENGNVL